MTTYTITAPNGKTYEIEGPEGATQAQVAQAVLARNPEAGRPSTAKSGTKAAFLAGVENLKGDLTGFAGRLGITDVEEAAKQQQAYKQKAEGIFKPTEEGWLDAPLTKIGELAGGSAPYMAAPLIAGGAATVGGAPTLVAAGAAGLASLGQFGATNVGRQVDEGKALKDTNLTNALLAATPMAALDMIGLGKIPGVRQMIGLVAKDVGKDVAVKIAGQTAKQVALDYAKATGTAMTAEGVTEAAQQVLERMQAGLAINDPAARKEYWDSLIGGAVLGGALAPAGRFVERGQIEGKQAEQAKADKIAAIKAAKEAKLQEELQANAANESTTGPAAIAPVDNADPRLMPRVAPQPDLFGGADQENGPAPDPTDPRKALADNEQTLNTLRKSIQTAHANNDLASVAQLSKLANDVAAQTKALQEAAQVGTMPPRPTVPANLVAMQKKLADAVANGDTAQAAVLTPKVQALEAQAKIANDLTSQAGTEAAEQRKADSRAPTLWQDADEKYAAEMGEQQDLLTANGARAPKKPAADPMAQFAADTEALDDDRLTGAIKNEFDKRDRAAEELAAAKAAPAPVEYAQKQIRGEGETEGTKADAKLEDTVSKLTETVVDPQALQLEKQIGDLEDARDQAKSAGREGDAATYQARIAELQRRGTVNPRNASALSTVDRLQKELDTAKKDRDDATATKNVAKAEESARRAAQIADQLAVAQKDPSSLVGRYARAMNDVSMYLSNFFDSMHELHTGTAEADAAAPRETLTLKSSPKQVIAKSKSVIAPYIRAVFREENIRREANNQPPLAGEVRKQFAADTQARADAILKRAVADRRGYREEVVVQPAQMRGNKVVRNAVTEKRDTRPLEDRPYAKFAAARAVEEEGFAADRAKVNQPPKPTRVETGVLKRQWAADEAKRTAEEQGENAKTLTGRMRRRAEYLGNQLDAAKVDVAEMREALDEYPTNAVMDALTPMVKDARTGLAPDADNLQRLREAVALEKEVAQDDTGQRSLLDESDTVFNRDLPDLFQNDPTVRKGRKAADKAALQARRDQDETNILRQREADKPTEATPPSLLSRVVDKARSEYMRAQDALITAFEENNAAQGDYGGQIETEAKKKEMAAALAAADRRVKIARQKMLRANALAEKAERTRPLTAKEKEGVAERKEREAQMDAAVEERMKLDEMSQRLAKLPALRVTKDNESAFAKLIGVGLRKEAAGHERMIEIEKAKETPDTAYITKLEGLLAKSNKAYEQLDSLLPTKIEQREEATVRPTRKEALPYTKDEEGRAPAEPARSAAAVAPDLQDVLQPSRAVVLRDKEAIEGTREKFKRPSQKATESGIASAQKLEEKNKGRGRGPLVVPVMGPRRMRNSGAVKQGTTKQAVDTANEMAHAKVIADADARIDYLETMQESTAAALARATESGKKKDIAKWTSHAERVDKALELARGDREFLSNADDISSLRGTSGVNDTALSDPVIDTLHNDKFAAAVEDIATNSKNPVTRRIAGNIAKRTKNVEVKMVEDMPGDTPDAPGGITADGKKIFINSRTGMSEETVLHEGAHAVVNAKLSAPESTLTKDQLDAKRELEAMHAQAKAAADLNNATAKDDDIKEFVAEGLGSKQMQTWLQVQEWTNTTGGNMWQRFKRAVLNMLGVKTPPDGKMLDRFLDLSERLMAAPLGEKGSRQAAVSSFRKQAPSYGNLDGSALADAAENLMPEQDNASFKDRVLKNAKLVFEMQAVDMRAPVRDALQAIAEAKGDTTDFEQTMYYMRKGDQSSSVIAAVLGNGFPKMDKTNSGARTYGASGGASYMDVMNDIGELPVKGANIEGKVELATTYLALQRAKSVGFNKLDFAGKVDAAKAAAVDKALAADPELKKALDKVRETYNAYNTGLVQFLADSGAISQQTAKDLLKNGDYMPYYRVDSNGMAQLWLDAAHPIALGEVRHQKHLAELKGGEDRILPLSESIVRNTALLMDKATINLTAKSVAYMLQDAGAGKIKRGKGVAGPDVIRFHQEPDPKDNTDTGERWMRVDTRGTAAEGVPTELLIKGLEGSRVMMPGVLQIMSSAGDLLRAGVTRTPMYLLRQLIRDPMASSFTAGLDTGPMRSVLNAGKEFIKSSRGTSDTHAKLIEKGLIQHPLFTGDRDDIAKFAKQIAENKTPGPLGKLFQMADGWATQADAATRALVYDNAIKNGMSPMQAEMLTMESMNFHKRGMSPSVQFANRAIPFFNAQIQGLNVMWKAVSGQMPYEEKLNIQRKFRNNAGVLAMAGFAYAAAMSDDDYYKRATAKDRMTNFFLHLPGVEEPIKIPIPYEMGYFFSLGVAAVESMRDEADGAELLRATRDMAVGSIPGASSMFLPQLIKPALEVYTNTSFYTGRGIETVAQQRLTPDQRYNTSTTELAKEISKAAPYLSPIQIEHLVKGYLGILPIAAMASANALLTDPDEATKPASRASDTPLFGSAFQRKAAGEDVTVAYKYAKEAEMAKASHDKLLKSGQKGAASEYRAEHDAVIRMSNLANNFSAAMAQFKQREEAIRNSKLTPEEKLEKLDALADKRSETAKKYVEKFEEQEATAA